MRAKNTVEPWIGEADGGGDGWLKKMGRLKVSCQFYAYQTSESYFVFILSKELHSGDAEIDGESGEGAVAKGPVESKSKKENVNVIFIGHYGL